MQYQIYKAGLNCVYVRSTWLIEIEVIFYLDIPHILFKVVRNATECQKVNK